jgi:predicted short-subunit dehydrogenase-like oxidoreductase (DUF2520 family)
MGKSSHRTVRNEELNNCRIVIIGAGNLATQLGLALKKAEFDIVQVFNRSIKNGKVLAKLLNSKSTNCYDKIVTDADFYIFAVSDNALKEVIANMPKLGGGVCVHTSGSTPMKVFAGFTTCYGVLYPLQTFSKHRNIDFRTTPVFVEGNRIYAIDRISALASAISDNVTEMPSPKRRELHLAAVFANNFTNYMYTIASNILKRQDIDPKALLPLIDETAAKLHDMTPEQAQTGPAVRGDINTIDAHQKLLKDPEELSIYLLLNYAIINRYEIKTDIS